VAARVVVRGVLLAGDELLGVEELAVRAGADLVDHGGLEVEEDAAGDVLARAGLGEEGVEGVVAAADGLVRGHLAGIPAWPMWMEMTSRMVVGGGLGKDDGVDDRANYGRAQARVAPKKGKQRRIAAKFPSRAVESYG